jgi:hypothetical protein
MSSCHELTNAFAPPASGRWRIHVHGGNSESQANRIDAPASRSRGAVAVAGFRRLPRCAETRELFAETHRPGATHGGFALTPPGKAPNCSGLAFACAGCGVWNENDSPTIVRDARDGRDHHDDDPRVVPSRFGSRPARCGATISIKSSSRRRSSAVKRVDLVRRAARAVLHEIPLPGGRGRVLSHAQRYRRIRGVAAQDHDRAADRGRAVSSSAAWFCVHSRRMPTGRPDYADSPAAVRSRTDGTASYTAFN